jgi:prepilin-type N-terminal cleavage/methylation domain-containing protein
MGAWPPDRRRRGVTLVEMMVALVVLSLVVAGIGEMLVSGWQAQEALAGQNRVQQLARTATDTISDSLRAATGLASGNAAQLTATFASGNTVSYYLQQGILKRTTYHADTGHTVAGETICPDTSALGFTYYARQGSGLVSAGATFGRAVQISVQVVAGASRATQTSLVDLRNKS